MNKPPIILISGSTDDKGAEFTDYSLSLSMNYPLALKAAGGLPWLLPCAIWLAVFVRRSRMSQAAVAEA